MKLATDPNVHLWKHLESSGALYFEWWLSCGDSLGFVFTARCSFPETVRLGEQFTPRIEFKINKVYEKHDLPSQWVFPLAWGYAFDEVTLDTTQLRYFYGAMDPKDAITLQTWENPSANQTLVWSPLITIEDLVGVPEMGAREIGFVIYFSGTDHSWGHTIFYGATMWPWEHFEPWDETFSENPLRCIVNIVALPECSFDAYPPAGEAPLYVEFTDTSTSPSEAPIRSWCWEFGDGATSIAPNPTHVYDTPGRYQATLTVTNDYGSDSCSIEINVVAAPVRPVFSDRCYCPDHIYVDEAFTPTLAIENEGGAGNIFLAVTTEGKRKVLVASLAIAAYDETEVDVGSHAISWYLGYTPTESKYVALEFEVGPVGADPTSFFSPTLAVIVEPGPVCTEGDTKCIGYDRYICSESIWELLEENSSACGYPEDEEEKVAWLPFVLIGLGTVVTGSSLYALSRRRR